MKIVRRLEKPTPGLVTYLDCVGNDIEMLNLNAERLRFAREKRWNDLVEISEGIDDPETMDVWVRAVLMPDEDGNLAPFFTTARCYFHPIGERILAEDPHAWI